MTILYFFLSHHNTNRLFFFFSIVLGSQQNGAGSESSRILCPKPQTGTTLTVNICYRRGTWINHRHPSPQLTLGSAHGPVCPMGLNKCLRTCVTITDPCRIASVSCKSRSPVAPGNHGCAASGVLPFSRCHSWSHTACRTLRLPSFHLVCTMFPSCLLKL